MSRNNKLMNKLGGLHCSPVTDGSSMLNIEYVHHSMKKLNNLMLNEATSDNRLPLDDMEFDRCDSCGRFIPSMMTNESNITAEHLYKCISCFAKERDLEQRDIRKIESRKRPTQQEFFDVR